MTLSAGGDDTEKIQVLPIDFRYWKNKRSIRQKRKAKVMEQRAKSKEQRGALPFAPFGTRTKGFKVALFPLPLRVTV